MPNAIVHCPVTTALSIIGGKWKVIILWHLKEGGVKRFGELQRMVRGISQKMLTQELRDLEESGLVARKVYPVVPPKVEYSLTETGWSLKPLLEQLCEWGLEYRKNRGEAVEGDMVAEPRPRALAAITD